MVFNKINKIFLFIFFSFAFINCYQAALVKDFTVVIDAGHGGHDPGAKGPYCNEKEVTLAVALKLGSLLSQKPGVKVVYTRTTDVFVELATRAQIANDAHADLFISVHCNSAHSGASGTETWVLGTEDNRQSDNFSVVKRENSVIFLEDDYEKTYDGFDPNSAEDLISMTLIQSTHYDSSVYMAQLVENEFKYKNRTSRGVKQSGFAVLWRTAMPSVLIEMGFISNGSEGQLLCSSYGQTEIANSIANAFTKYKQLWDKKNTNTVVQIQEVPKKEEPIKNGFYKVQILASTNFYSDKSPQLRGLEDVVVIKNGGFYKYYYGTTDYESEKNQLVDKAKKAGFTSAYSVLFKDNSEYEIELFSSNKKYATWHTIFNGNKDINRVKNSSGTKYSYRLKGKYTYSEGMKEIQKLHSKDFPKAVLVNI